MSIETSNWDLARQYLSSLAQNGEISLEDALDASIGGTKLGDLPDVKGILTGLAVDGRIPVETVLACVSSRYTLSDEGLVPKGSGIPADAAGINLQGLSAMAELMLLVIRLAAEQRKAGQEIRQAQSELIQNKLFDAAEDMRNGAIAAMALGIAAGVASIAGGAAGLFGSPDLASSKTGIGGGFSTIFSSLGQGIQGILNADAKEKEAEAEKMRSEREAEGDIIANLKDFMQTTLQLLQTMLEKESDTLTKILV
jgi:hypothetical protein